MYYIYGKDGTPASIEYDQESDFIATHPNLYKIVCEEALKIGIDLAEFDFEGYHADVDSPSQDGQVIYIREVDEMSFAIEFSEGKIDEVSLEQD
jgi:hypothetical protein